MKLDGVPLEGQPETELAWLAGLIDGDGCISMTRRSPTGRCVNPQYVSVLKVSMCHELTVRYVHELVGFGSVSYKDRGVPGHRPQWSWWATNRQMIRVLEAIRPYLFTKAEEADIALEWGRLPLAKRGGRRGSSPVSPELLAAREDIFCRLRDAKGRIA